MQPLRVPRGLLGILLACLTLLATSCAHNPTNAFALQSEEPPNSTYPAPETSVSVPQSRECKGIAGAGNFSMVGNVHANVVFNPSGTIYSFSCGDGSDVHIEQISGNAATFTTAGIPVTISEGLSASVGTYQITVVSANGRTVEFTVVPNS